MAWRILRDGRLVKEVETEQQAWAYLHSVQGQSVEWATKYEGWKIEEVVAERSEEGESPDESPE